MLKTTAAMSFAMALALLSLGGCMGPVGRMMAQTDDESCRSYGVQPGSNEYYQCRMTKDQNRRAALRNFGESLRANQPRTCTTIGMSPGWSSTTCR